MFYSTENPETLSAFPEQLETSVFACIDNNHRSTFGGSLEVIEKWR